MAQMVPHTCLSPGVARRRLYSYGPYSCGLYGHGLHSYGLYSYGLYSYGLYSHVLGVMRRRLYGYDMALQAWRDDNVAVTMLLTHTAQTINGAVATLVVASPVYTCV